MASILSPNIPPARVKTKRPLELYLWPNNPERLTITTDMGLPEYQVFTGEGRLFGSGPISSIEKLWDGPDGGVRVGVSYICVRSNYFFLMSDTPYQPDTSYSSLE